MTVDEYEIWFEFFRVYYKKIDTPESLIVLSSPEKLALLSLLEEAKNNKTSTPVIIIVVISTTTRLSLKLVVEWQWLSHFPAKMTLAYVWAPFRVEKTSYLSSSS